jgi:hypothetical protein
MIRDTEYRATVIQSQRALVDEIYSVESITKQYLDLFV